jgi:hypothetical protein
VASSLYSDKEVFVREIVSAHPDAHSPSQQPQGLAFLRWSALPRLQMNCSSGRSVSFGVEVRHVFTVDTRCRTSHPTRTTIGL